MLRHQRQVRRHLRAGAALLAMIGVIAGALLSKREPPVAPPMAEAPLTPAPLVIRSVNDEELFALLQGAPSALLKLPNGDSRLLIIDEQSTVSR